MRGRPPKSEAAATSPRIWVDADDCPPSAMQTLFRFANDSRVVLTLVGSSPQAWPNSQFIRSVVLCEGFEVSTRIAGVMSAGDVVVTADKALASSAGQKRATALSPREGSALTGLLEQGLGRKRAAVPAAQA